MSDVAETTRSQSATGTGAVRGPLLATRGTVRATPSPVERSVRTAVGERSVPPAAPASEVPTILPEADAPRAASGRRPHLLFLDSLRGLAALYVALGHAYVTIRPQLDFSRMRAATVQMLKLTDLGHFAVAVFIVLSGFCLMLPVARRTDGTIPGGTAAFLKRRSRRILPPYYAALALSVVLMGLLGVLADGPGPGRGPEGALTAGGLLGHALLVHNLVPQWAEAVNGPMWSVALEYQIYFLFPLVLLPVWRRWGAMAALAAAFAIGLSPMLLPERLNFHWTFPWYLGLFALGMSAAVVSFSPAERLRVARERIPWGFAAAALAVLMLGCLCLRAEWSWKHLWLVDTGVGVSAAALVTYLALQSQRPGRFGGRWLRFLSARWLVGLGAFSYSLYLIHMPIMLVAGEALRQSGIDPLARLGLQAGIVLPLTVGIAYLFYTAFERPFVSGGRPRSGEERALAA